MGKPLFNNIITTIGFIIFFIACRQNFNRKCDNSFAADLPPYNYRDTLISMKTLRGINDSIKDTLLFIPWDFKTYYFPGDSSAYPSASLDLYAMKEPMLYKERCEGEIYRFYWWRPFHHPVSVRIEHRKGVTQLYIKMYQFKNKGQLVLDECQKVSEREWKEFKKLLDNASYWKVVQYGSTVDFSKPDASSWILEGLNEKNYRIVKRANGGEPEFKTCCEYLLTLSKYHNKIL